jgi:hypothetical protein
MGGGPVVVDLAQRPLVDQGARHRPQVGQAAVHETVRDVPGGGDHLIGLRDQVHGLETTRALASPTGVDLRERAGAEKMPRPAPALVTFARHW